MTKKLYSCVIIIVGLFSLPVTFAAGINQLDEITMQIIDDEVPNDLQIHNRVKIPARPLSPVNKGIQNTTSKINTGNHTATARSTSSNTKIMSKPAPTTTTK